MADHKVIDFDAYRKEREARLGEAEAVVFRIGGRDYPLPPEPPAAIALDVIRLKADMKDATADVPLAALAKIGGAMFGDDAFREMLVENNVGAAEMGDLIIQAFGAWKIDVEDGEARPNRRARRAKPST